MKVAEKGQVTNPKDIRDALGIGAGTEVEFERRNDSIVLLDVLTRDVGRYRTCFPTVRAIAPSSS